MTSNNKELLRRNLWWIRETNNLIFPLGEPNTFDSNYCMNPFVLRIGDEYHLYYAGGDKHDDRRICLATAPVDNLTQWTRHGPILELGDAGSFDAKWAVLPHIVQINPNRWHLYYTGNSGIGQGLSAFPGIGLAISDDGKHWQKYENSPILAPTGKVGDSDAMGIAGGSVIKVLLPDGQTEWRFYYTGCPTIGDDIFLDQQKQCCFATSQDAIHWERQGAIMWRNPDHDYENVAVAGPVASQLEDGTYQMWYSAIGTRWGAYSIAYAESDDGITWQRGTHYGDNLQIGPVGTGWEQQMVEYPFVIREDEHLRLFYCGNDYGGSGIGTALSSALRATPTQNQCEVIIVAQETQMRWICRVPQLLSCDEGTLMNSEPTVWHGPDANGMIWHEALANHNQEKSALIAIDYRVLITPTIDGLDIRFTIHNKSEQALHNLQVTCSMLWLQNKNNQPQILDKTLTWSDADEQYALSISWEQAYEILSSSVNTNEGLSMAIRLDVLQTGETKTIQGKIVYSNIIQSDL